MTQKERTKKRKTEFISARLKLTQNLIDIGESPESCEMCGNQANEDHHIIKKAVDNYKYNSDVNNLIRVCRSCHVLFHSSNSDELININKDRFLSVIKWFRQEDKEGSIICLEENASEMTLNTMIMEG